MSELTTQSSQPAPVPCPPAPQPGMLVKVHIFNPADNSTTTSGPWVIAAVSANGRTVWTRSGRQVRLGEPNTRVELRWPGDEFERWIEPVVTGLNEVDVEEEAA